MLDLLNVPTHVDVNKAFSSLGVNWLHVFVNQKGVDYYVRALGIALIFVYDLFVTSGQILRFLNGNRRVY